MIHGIENEKDHWPTCHDLYKSLHECVEKENNKKQQHEDDIKTESTKLLAMMDL